MTDEEKKAVNLLKVFKLSFKDNKPYKTTYTLANGNEYTGKKIENIFEIVLNLLEKQEKVIDKMATELDIAQDRYEYMGIDDIKQYFYRKVERR